MTTDYTDETDQQLIHEELSGKIIAAVIVMPSEVETSLISILSDGA